MRGKALIVVLLLCAGIFHLGLIIFPTTVSSGTLYVGGGGPLNYTTIQDAINASNPGDTVYVFNGTYYESVKVNRTLNLTGEDKNTTIIDGRMVGDVIEVTADLVNITGFTVTNSSLVSGAGIRLNYSDDCTISYNNISSVNYVGVFAFYSNRSTFHNNTVLSNLFSGIFLGYSHNSTVDNNTLLGNNPGIALYHADNNTVENNTALNNSAAIGMSFSDSNTIYNNNASNNSYGIYLGSSIGNTINNNNISSNTNEGIYLDVSNQDNIITNNTISYNMMGVYDLYSGPTTIIHNDFIGNIGTGLSLFGSSGTVSVNNVSGSNNGITLTESNVFSIAHNNVSDNFYGIHVWDVIDIGVPRITMSNNSVWENTYGIYLTESSRDIIVDNNISNNTEYGVFLNFSHHNFITNNTVEWNVHGIYLNVSQNNTIDNNTLRDNTDEGIALVTSFWNTIENNSASNSARGIYLTYSSENTLSNNNASLNSLGEGIYLSESSNNTLIKNNASGNRYGIILWVCNDNTVLDNSVFSNNQFGVQLVASDANNVTESTVSLNEGGGITLIVSDMNTFTNNTIGHNNGTAGIYLWSFNNNNTIYNNSMMGNPDGIYLTESYNNTIAYNNISESWAFGINLDLSNQNDIVHNYVGEGWFGILLEDSNNNSIADNNVSNNEDGITLQSSNNNTITNNTASIITRNGIELYYSDNNTLYNNTATLNSWGAGIFVQHSDNNTVSRNNVSLNDPVGIHFELSYNNRIYHNRFINNTVQAFDIPDANQWDNGYPSGGNYWSDYTGIDIYSGPNQNQPGGDSLGDTPYVIDADSFDRYPFTEPTSLPPPAPPAPLDAFLIGTNFENVTLSWALSPDDGQISRPVFRYDIYRNTNYNPNGTGYTYLASVPNGTSQFVDILAGEGDPSGYFYQICAVGPIDSTNCSSQQLAKFRQPLVGGLNLVSIPLQQSDESIGTVLQTASFDKAWFYDSFEQKWKSLMTFKPYPRGLGIVNHTIGFWVNATELSNLTVAGLVPMQTTIHLQAGWNLVGFPSFNSTYAVGDLRAQTMAARVEGLNPMAPPYFLKQLFDGNSLWAGLGYWVYVESSASWTVDNF